MDYESFKEKFVEDVKDRLYEQGAEVHLSIHTVNKLNESYEAITITPEGSNIGVNIGIDKFYGAVEDGRPYDEVVDKAVDIINNGINQRPEFDTVYEEDIRLVSVMRMDFELLEEIIEDLDESDSKIMKQYLLEGRLFKEIADDEGRTYEAIKKRMERIRSEIREEILECLEMNCRGGE